MESSPSFNHLNSVFILEDVERTSNRTRGGTFWKKVFGTKESLKPDVAERESTRPSAISDPEPGSILATDPSELCNDSEDRAELALPELLPSDSAAHSTLEMVEPSLQATPDLDSRNENEATSSPRSLSEIAAWLAQESAPAVQVAEDAEVTVNDHAGATTLHEAALYGSKGVMNSLLADGADINSQDNTGRSPLHYAVLCGSQEAVELLLAKGANANVRNDRGGTPLHSAASIGHREIAELLLAHQADVNASNNFGGTPLHEAASRCHMAGCKNVLDLLLASNADVSAKDMLGNLPLHDAELSGNEEVVELLRQYGNGGHE